ncbi:MAG: 30S ribosomal protein S6 [Candidatus Omnitrophica bacterium]|nr:30S ribosomal protein S6 [Candidatus Omnitrophota bacterium]
MNRYEAFCIVKPDLSEEDKKVVFSHMQEVITKYQGLVSKAEVWAERRKFTFPLKKYEEGTYYLLEFSAPPLSITDIRRAYNLNENILRTLFTVLS